MEEKNDIDGLIKALNHDEYLIRKEAARSLKKVGDERVVEPLIMSLKYEEWQVQHIHLNAVREYSAEALGIIGDKRAVNPLINAMKEDIDDDVRWKSAWALGKIGDEDAVDSLIEALNDDCWTVRENSTKALGNIGSLKAVEPLIITLNSDEWRLRKYAAASIGKIGDERGVKPLLNMLNDNDDDVSRSAIDALGNMGDMAFKPLMELFKEDDDWYIRSKAAEALGNIGDIRAVRTLIDALSNKKKKDRNRFIRGRALEALGKIGDIRAVDIITIALDDNILFVRQKAEDALERIRLSQSHEIIHFDDGEILFDYPINWDIKTIINEKKIVKGIYGENVTFTINRGIGIDENSLDEFIDILKEAFILQNIRVISEKTLKTGEMEGCLITCENLDLYNILIIAGFKLYERIYYLQFSIEPELFEDVQEDINLIINSFYILN
jgi:HEAT repeat protein